MCRSKYKSMDHTLGEMTPSESSKLITRKMRTAAATCKLTRRIWLTSLKTSRKNLLLHRIKWTVLRCLLLSCCTKKQTASLRSHLISNLVLTHRTSRNTSRSWGKSLSLKMFHLHLWAKSYPVEASEAQYWVQQLLSSQTQRQMFQTTGSRHQSWWSTSET